MALYYIALQGENNVYPEQPGGLKTAIINLLIRCLQCTPGKEEDMMEMRAVLVFFQVTDGQAILCFLVVH